MFGEYCGTTLRQFSKTISYWRNTLFLFLDQFFQLSLLYEVGCIFFDIDNFLIISKCIFPKSIIWKNADISAIDNFSIISPTWCPPLSVRKCRRLRTRKLRLVLRRKLRTSLPLQPWFVLSSSVLSKFSSSCVGLGGGCHKPRGGGEDKGRQWRRPVRPCPGRGRGGGGQAW